MTIWCYINAFITIIIIFNFIMNRKLNAVANNKMEIYAYGQISQFRYLDSLISHDEYCT